MKSKLTRTQRARANKLESLALWVDAGLKDWFRRECERKGVTLTMGLHRLLAREQKRIEGRRK